MRLTSLADAPLVVRRVTSILATKNALAAPSERAGEATRTHTRTTPAAPPTPCLPPRALPRSA
jgi:hypothetical protein